jgi:hypothetical protein
MVEIHNLHVHPVPFNYHFYPNIRQEFFLNLSSEKLRVTLRLYTELSMFFFGISLEIEDSEGGESCIQVNTVCILHFACNSMEQNPS